MKGNRDKKRRVREGRGIYKQRMTSIFPKGANTDRALSRGRWCVYGEFQEFKIIVRWTLNTH